MSTNKISVISVNYNSTEYLNKFITSTQKIDEIIKEIVVVDNNSKDINKIRTNQKTILIKNTKNFGFAKAVNQGIRIAKSKIVLLINPDSVLLDKSPIETYKIIKNDKKIGAIGGKIITINNKIQKTATSKPNFLTGLFEFTNLKKIFPNNIYSKKFWVENGNINKPTEVNSLCGAYMFFRKGTNKNLNLFDENYFMYMEDIDFGLSLISKGYKIIFDPNSQVKHIGGVSSNSKYNIVLGYWYKSRKYFFQKHLNKIESFILTIIYNTEEYLLTLYHHLKNEPTE